MYRLHLLPVAVGSVELCRGDSLHRFAFGIAPVQRSIYVLTAAHSAHTLRSSVGHILSLPMAGRRRLVVEGKVVRWTSESSGLLAESSDKRVVRALHFRLPSMHGD